jgi:hypothetical protein
MDAKQHLMKKRWVHLLLALGVGGLAWASYQVWGVQRYKVVHNFDECVDADYPFSDEDPQVCTDPKGHKFVHTSAAQEPVPPQTALSFDTLVFSNNGPVKAERTVITNQADWAAFWKRIHTHLSFKPTLIPVDFTKKQVVAVVSGQHPTPGYYTKVEEVTQNEDVVLVAVDESSPPAGCTIPGGPISPYHLIQIDKTTLVVRFAIRQNIISANCKTKK